MSRVHILHDNPDWLPPFREAFAAEGVPFDEILLGEGSFDLDGEPPAGVFWSRLSASAHTRGRPFAKEHARALLGWASAHGRPVVGGPGVVELEVSKARQHAVLSAAGIDVPRTTVAAGIDALREVARATPLPFIVKHNQGGKGLGVRLIGNDDDLDAYLEGEDAASSVDGIVLVQEHLVAQQPFVTRAEFVGGRFVYAVRVDTTAGSFELCPAEACAVGDVQPAPPFAIRPSITADDPLVRQYEGFLSAQGIDIAGIEFIETTDGRRVTYDVNTNTNYNPAVEASVPVSAARHVARFLGGRLADAPGAATDRARGGR